MKLNNLNLEQGIEDSEIDALMKELHRRLGLPEDSLLIGLCIIIEQGEDIESTMIGDKRERRAECVLEAMRRSVNHMRNDIAQGADHGRTH